MATCPLSVTELVATSSALLVGPMRKRPRGEAGAEAGPSRSSADELLAERRRLPVWEARNAFLTAFSKTDTLVLTGETGCGKTTQIPQFLLAAGYAQHGAIGVTQPRRVAAMSVAQRVAYEQGEEVGGRVGYCVRFDECVSPETQLRYLTDGMLLREAVAVPSLSRYAVVIVDEAHERSLHTDMMLALLRRAQMSREKGRTPLKLIVMSATLDTSVFCEYFKGAPAVQVVGRQFPVSVFYANDPPADYLEAAATAVMQVHTEEEMPGDVLCFLPGQEDIDAIAASLKQRCAQLEAEAANGAGETGGGEQPASKRAAGWHQMAIHPLYAALPAAMQLRALEPAPAGTRKVILATNIAETSLTIDGVVHVVDTGLAKVRMYHPARRIDSLLATPISKAAARQRSGRAGRQQPGKCFRLFTEETYMELSERNVPEIQRTSLASAILSLRVSRLQHLNPPPLHTRASSLPRGATSPCSHVTRRCMGMISPPDHRPVKPRATQARACAYSLRTRAVGAWRHIYPCPQPLLSPLRPFEDALGAHPVAGARDRRRAAIRVCLASIARRPRRCPGATAPARCSRLERKADR